MYPIFRVWASDDTAVTPTSAAAINVAPSSFFIIELAPFLVVLDASESGSERDVRLPSSASHTIESVRIIKPEQPDHGQLDHDAQSRAAISVAELGPREAVPRIAEVEERMHVDGGRHQRPLHLGNCNGIEAAAGKRIIAPRHHLVEVVTAQTEAPVAAQAEELVVGHVLAAITIHFAEGLVQHQHELPRQPLIPRELSLVALNADIAAQPRTRPARVEGGARAGGGMEG